MTPFRIRARIKKLLGLDRPAPPPRPAVPRHPVVFHTPDGGSYTAEGKRGDLLTMISGRGPQPVATGCADSSCGTCAVEVLAGSSQLSPEDERETATKAANGVPAHLRLACRAALLGPGVELRVLRVLGMDGVEADEA